MSGQPQRRRVGTVRPSHLMFTSGVGALVDLPNFSVIVNGLEEWQYDKAPTEPIAEPRLLAAVKSLRGHHRVERLMPAPYLDGIDVNPNGDASRVGVPVLPFPAWLRCTACNELAPLESEIFGFENAKARRPQDARFSHTACARKRRPLAVAARFLLACTNGHLDDFPYARFVHRGDACPKASHPRLQMDDRGGNITANVELRCVSCQLHRNMRDALGSRGKDNLPGCRGRHPHLGTSYFEPKGCDQPTQVLVIGASNQWFAQTLSALAVPPTDASEIEAIVEQYYDKIAPLSPAMIAFGRQSVPAFQLLARWSDDQINIAVEAVRAKKSHEPQAQALADGQYPDLRTAEWEVFTAAQAPAASDDFTISRLPDGVPKPLEGLLDDVVLAERLREVRALIGFTRLDAPDPEEPDLVTRVGLARDNPTWVPASEVRGEGLFLRVSETLLAEWAARVEDSAALTAHCSAYRRYRENRFSDRISGPFDPMRHWPGARYIALHTLSHLLIRTIALECGYSSASLSERIYADGDGDGGPRSGILIYTAVPDAEGTLGGLVSQGEPEPLTRLVRRALRDATRCSSDPLCAERLPADQADFLHGAACHICLFVSETTCERGNRFLDRRFVVPIDQPGLALVPELP